MATLSYQIKPPRFNQKMNTFYVDVGTHCGQEYSALFEAPLSRLMINFLLYKFRSARKGQSSQNWSSIKDFIRNSVYLRTQRRSMHCIFIEPNHRLCALPIYQKADTVFNIALSSNSEAASIMPLYFSDSDKLGQGSSLFESKPNIKISEFDYVVNLDAEHFAKQLKLLFKACSLSDYRVVLRINNEGAETEVIEAFSAIFGDRLAGVMGSLADVAKVKDQGALDSLMRFMNEKGIPFIPFHSNIATWLEASRFLVRVLKQA
jgi:hypothetical protein